MSREKEILQIEWSFVGDYQSVDMNPFSCMVLEVVKSFFLVVKMYQLGMSQHFFPSINNDSIQISRFVGTREWKESTLPAMDRVHNVVVEGALNTFTIWIAIMIWKMKEAWGFPFGIRLFSTGRGRKAVECFLKGPVEEIMIVSSSAKAVEEERK